MQTINAWKLAEQLTAYQIALLMTGNDPSDVHDYYKNWSDELKTTTLPFLSAIQNAAKSGRLKLHEVKTHNQKDIDWEDSTIEIASLIEWLKERNFKDRFFLNNPDAIPAIAEKNSPFYAPKLAAAVRAWTEVTNDPTAMNGKSPKRVLEIWLRKHANEYGLTNKEGNPNELGIEEICKVANWKPSGGASPTPTSSGRAVRSPARGGKIKS